MSEIRLMTEEELKQQREEAPIGPPKICARCNRTIPYNMRYRRSRKYHGLLCQRCDNELWRAKGYQAERDLVKRLQKLGFNAMRHATSGSGNEPVPDVSAIHPKTRLAIAVEVKSTVFKQIKVFAWKKKKGEKRKPSQLIKAIQYLRDTYPTEICKDANIVRQYGVACKFLLGSRTKSPWIVRLFDMTNNLDLGKVPNMICDISSKSSMPELTNPTISKRAKYIIKVRTGRLQTKKREKT